MDARVAASEARGERLDARMDRMVGATAGGFTAQIGEQLREINGRLDVIDKRSLAAEATVGARSSGSLGSTPGR